MLPTFGPTLLWGVSHILRIVDGDVRFTWVGGIPYGLGVIDGVRR